MIHVYKAMSSSGRIEDHREFTSRRAMIMALAETIDDDELCDLASDMLVLLARRGHVSPVLRSEVEG